MEIKEIRCSACNSNQIYTRVTTGQRVCKKCGHVEKTEIKEVMKK